MTRSDRYYYLRQGDASRFLTARFVEARTADEARRRPWSAFGRKRRLSLPAGIGDPGASASTSYTFFSKDSARRWLSPLTGRRPR